MTNKIWCPLYGFITQVHTEPLMYSRTMPNRPKACLHLVILLFLSEKHIFSNFISLHTHQEYLTLPESLSSFFWIAKLVYEVTDKAAPSKTTTVNIMACINIKDIIISRDVGFL